MRTCFGRTHEPAPHLRLRLFAVMKIRNRILGSLIAFVFVCLSGQTPCRALESGVVTLVSTGACWNLHDRGTDLGSNWIHSGVDDSFWLSGFGELGYGDGDEATLVSYGADSTNKYITTYFRHEFLAPAPSAFTNLLLRVKRDDGVVVFLNGTEVYRDSLPPSPTYLTPASLAADDGANFITTNVSPLLLLPGENYLAVEIHQATNDDPDISFDLALLGQFSGAAPTLSGAVVGASQFVVSWPGSISAGFVLQSSGQLISNAWSTVTNPVFLSGGMHVVTNTRSHAPRFFRLAVDAQNVAPCQPPIVLDQPLSMFADIGTNITISVVATGTPPILYQWYRNLLPVPGANSPTLALTNVQRADGGSYELAMNGACDGNFSYPVIVTVGGTNEAMSDMFAGRPVYNAVSGMINCSNYFATAEAGEPGHAGQAASRSMWLSFVAPQNGIVTFATEGSAFDTLLAAYHGTNVAGLGLIDADDDQGPAYTSVISFAVTNGESIEVAVDNYPFNAGAFQLSWNMVATTNHVPIILVQPQSLVTPLGSNFTLSVTATNPGPGVLTYQWRHNGSNLLGATLSSLTVSNATAANAGAYDVLVSNTTNSKRSQTAFVALSVGTGRLITVTSSNKRRKCGTTNYYTGVYTNDASGSNRYFSIPSEPAQVLTWTSSGGTVVNYKAWAYRQAPLMALCTATRTSIDPTPLGGGPYNYYFEILIVTPPVTFYVEHSP